MSEKSPFDWALLAVAAATIKVAEVTVVANDVEPDLPAFAIGDTVVCQVRDVGARHWIVNHCWYRTLAEALAEAVSAEVYRRAEAELGPGGLAT